MRSARRILEFILTCPSLSEVVPWGDDPPVLHWFVLTDGWYWIEEDVGAGLDGLREPCRAALNWRATHVLDNRAYGGRSDCGALVRPPSTGPDLRVDAGRSMRTGPGTGGPSSSRGCGAAMVAEPPSGAPVR
ncbi:DUF5984 family protein [Nonomuraea sp. NPDC049655]|uniref:DUF5984 family protein n=1 Tax=Nonomuraea sp. NPDC049655 TaxID=3364355 RepID=UPI0037AF8D80